MLGNLANCLVTTMKIIPSFIVLPKLKKFYDSLLLKSKGI